ncbi:MAG TPA: OsmC family protein [Gemmatimonadales bacterium]|jgi:putative redox protein
MPIETKRVSVSWEGGLRFRGGEPGNVAILIDGDNSEAPGPMLTLLLAAASCTGSDVVVILEKMRVKLQDLRIDITGVRREAEPRRYTALHLDYQLKGEGLDESKARRAIELSVQKYCSVLSSLAPDIKITHGLSLA